MTAQALQRLGEAVEVTDDGVPLGGPGQADPRDVNKFNSALEATDEVAPTSPTSPTSPSDAASGRALASRTMGDNILSGLNNVSTDLQTTWQSLSDSLRGDLSATKLLQVQMGISHLVLEYELVSKAVSRSTQNIDQLVKLQ